MTESVEVPVVVTPEAATRIAELGMQAELERMLEHARQTIPGLQRLEVERAERYDLGEEPGVAIDAYTAQSWVAGAQTSGNWREWMINTFPPRVCEHFAFTILHRNSHAG